MQLILAKMGSKARMSGQLMERITNNADENIETNRREWEKAVTEELKTLDERQDELEDRILKTRPIPLRRESLTTEDILKHEFDEKLDALTQRMHKQEEDSKNEIQCLKEIINALRTRVIENEDIIKELRRQLCEDVEEIVQQHEEKLEDIEKTVNNIKTSVQTSSRISEGIDTSRQKLTLKMPIFKGEPKERPIKFLTDLKRYIEVTKPNEKELIYIFSQALQGSTENWYNLNAKDIHNFDNFERKFREHYWSDAAQIAAKRKLEFGHYNSSIAMSRVNYAMDLFNLAIELDQDRNDAETVKQLTQHFERDVRCALRGQISQNKELFFATLAEFDNDDAQNRQVVKKFTDNRDVRNNNNYYQNNNNYKNNNKFKPYEVKQIKISETNCQKPNKQRQKNAVVQEAHKQIVLNEAVPSTSYSEN